MPRSTPELDSLIRLINDSSTDRLLASQGDGRHRIGDSGTNRYLNRYYPVAGLASFGSCTSSTISESGHRAAERLHGWLRSIDHQFLLGAFDDLYDRVRAELIGTVALHRSATTDVVLAPSGTDSEFIPLLAALAGGRPVTNIVVAPAEVGSGSASAAGGLHFDPLTPAGGEVTPYQPVDPDTADQVEVVRVPVREPHGAARPVTEIDAEVHDHAAASLARGRDVLIHLVAHSKTGLHAPSIDAVERLSAVHPGRVLVVVDAAQGRFSRRGLDESLQRGWMTIVTGSKFFGGPPFAGAVLVPHAVWQGRDRPVLPPGFDAYFCRSMLPASWGRAKAALPAERVNAGLLMRWRAALSEIRDYYSVPSRLRFEVLQRFQSQVPTLLAKYPGIDFDPVLPPRPECGATRLLESNATVFSFTCSKADGSSMSHAELGQVRATIRGVEADNSGADAAGCEIGQPVTVGEAEDAPSILRIALGARTVTRTCVVGEDGPTFADRLDRLDRSIEDVIARISTAVGSEVPGNAA